MRPVGMRVELLRAEGISKVPETLDMPWSEVGLKEIVVRMATHLEQMVL